MSSEDDDAALINSFFLPGGILDPEEDEDEDLGPKLSSLSANPWSTHHSINSQPVIPALPPISASWFNREPFSEPETPPLREESLLVNTALDPPAPVDLSPAPRSPGVLQPQVRAPKLPAQSVWNSDHQPLAEKLKHSPQRAAYAQVVRQSLPTSPVSPTRSPKQSPRQTPRRRPVSNVPPASTKKKVPSDAESSASSISTLTAQSTTVESSTAAPPERPVTELHDDHMEWERPTVPNLSPQEEVTVERRRKPRTKTKSEPKKVKAPPPVVVERPPVVETLLQPEEWFLVKVIADVLDVLFRPILGLLWTVLEVSFSVTVRSVSVAASTLSSFVDFTVQTASTLDYQVVRHAMLGYYVLYSGPAIVQAVRLHFWFPRLAPHLSAHGALYLWSSKTLSHSLLYIFALDAVSGGLSSSSARYMLLPSHYRMLVAYVLSCWCNGMLGSPIVWCSWAFQMLMIYSGYHGPALDVCLLMVGIATLRLMCLLQTSDVATSGKAKRRS